MLIKNIENSPFSKIVTFIGEHVIYVYNPFAKNTSDELDELNTLVYHFMTINMDSGRNHFIMHDDKHSFIGLGETIKWFEENISGLVYIAVQEAPEDWGTTTYYIYFEKYEDEVAFKLKHSSIKSASVVEFIKDN